MTRLSFPRCASLALILGLFFAVSAHAQNVMEGTPYTPVFEVAPNGRPDMIVSKLRLDQVYDTNLISTPNNHLGGTYSKLEADISYVHQHPGSIFMLTYEGGGNLYPQPEYSNLNADSNTVRATLRQSLTKRMNLAASGDWGDVPGAGFEAFPGGQFGSGDDNAEFLARRHIVEDGSVSLQYQVTEHTYFAWGGNVNDTRYVAAQTSIFSASRSEDAYVSYYYEFSRSQTVSVGYSNQWIGFPGRDIHAQVHNFLTTYSNNLTPRLSFSGYVGPALVDEVSQKSAASSSTVSTDQLNVVGGASLKFDTGHSDVIVRYDRMYSRGSGLAGTSLRQTSSASFSQRFSQHLVTSVLVNYTQNDFVSVEGGSYTSWRVQPTVRYHMSSRIWLTASEGYVRAIRLDKLGPLDRNIATFGIEFDPPNFILERQ